MITARIFQLRREAGTFSYQCCLHFAGSYTKKKLLKRQCHEISCIIFWRILPLLILKKNIPGL
jgi:hypothetical protein